MSTRKEVRKAYINRLIDSKPADCQFRGVTIKATIVDEQSGRVLVNDGIQFESQNTIWITEENAAGQGNPKSLEAIIVNDVPYRIQQFFKHEQGAFFTLTLAADNP